MCGGKKITSVPKSSKSGLGGGKKTKKKMNNFLLSFCVYVTPGDQAFPASCISITD